MTVIIGIDPHKASHTAVRGRRHEPARRVAGPVRPQQVDRLLEWAAPFAERTWAIEGWSGSAICWPNSSSPR